MKLFQPKQAYFEEAALDYPLGVSIYDQMTGAGVPVKIIGSHNRIPGKPQISPMQGFREGKQTLVVGVRKDLKMPSCKPSADHEFAIATGCPGGCEYCYLQTHLGRKPYIRVYVNVDEILNKIREIAQARQPETVTFEAASTSDPLAVEHITGSLGKTIGFAGELENVRLRVVSKFAGVEPLLNLPHQGHTRFRFSLNTAAVIQQFEHYTATFEERIEAANQVAGAGYPLGFIIAPLIIYDGYEKDYADLFNRLAKVLPLDLKDLTFELITHRFTGSAKKIILERFPGTKLDLDETTRRRKYGKYGLVKYIYSENNYSQLKELMLQLVEKNFPNARVEYYT